MKKTVFALFAVLLVLSLATCDLFEPPAGIEGNLPKPTDGNREMVRLTIGVGNNGISRALTLPQAQANVNILEVAFTDGTDVYRTSWNGGDTYLDVPAGDYTGPEKAVVLAGYDNGSGIDLTLLAVGKITNINGGGDLGASPAIIDKTTTGVTFTLIPLEGGVTNTIASAFHILGPTSLSLQTNDGTKGISTYNDTFPYPVYTLPARYNYSVNDSGAANPSGLNTTENVIGQWNFTNSYYAGLKQKGSWTVASTYTISEIGSEPKVEVGVTPRFPRANDSIDGKFYFTINLGNVSGGYSKISMKAPVVAIKDTVSPNGTAALTWNIRGGINNDELDLDTGSGSDGGAVLLYIDDQMVHLLIGTHS